jgi:glucosamine-phosphate N-acetyltransferase
MADLIIRELEEKDFKNGFLTTLDVLRETSSMSEDKALEIFKRIKSNPEHIIIIAEIEGRVIGSTTLLIEPKFIHQGGVVGHIEDVVVDKKFQGKKIGEKIITHVLEIAKNHGCYQIVLNHFMRN